jgi:uroporphyrinogen-III synthase
MGKSNGRIEAPITHEGTNGTGVSVAGAASQNLVGLRARLLAASGRSAVRAAWAIGVAAGRRACGSAAGRRAWAVGRGTCRRLGRALAQVRAVGPWRRALERRSEGEKGEEEREKVRWLPREEEGRGAGG